MTRFDSGQRHEIWLEVPRYARDFGSGLPLRSRPLGASSSIPDDQFWIQTESNYKAKGPFEKRFP